MNKVYLKSRYDKGEAAYLNCPMTKEEFMAFHEALTTAEEAPLNSFEKEKYFEGVCLSRLWLNVVSRQCSMVL